ncbi:MAG: hypothetical protein ACYC6M_16690 [Terriglobales bacterium]
MHRRFNFAHGAVADGAGRQLNHYEWQQKPALLFQAQSLNVTSEPAAIGAAGSQPIH